MRRKRQRVHAPSVPAPLPTSTWVQSDPRSLPYPSVTPNDSFHHPVHTPQGSFPPLSAMASGAYVYPIAFSGSSSSMLGLNGRQVEVVDLTMDDDADLARRLQTQYDAETSQQQSYSYPAALKSDRSRPRKAVPVTETIVIDDDERIARELQAELNGETSRPSYRLDTKMSPGDHNLDFRQSMTDNDDQDAAYARRLQAEYDEERIAASAPSAQLKPETYKHPERQASSTSLDPHASRRLLQNFAEAVRHTGCAGCGKPTLSSENELVLRFQQWFEKAPSVNANVSSILVCKAASCSAATCLGCGILSKTFNPEREFKLDNGCIVSWCCGRGRTVLMWILLCGFDRRRTVKKRRDDHFRKPSAKPSNASHGTGTGVGYGGAYSSYPAPKAAQPVKYGKYGVYAPPGVPIQPVATSVPAEAAEDEITERLMACLNVLLPSLEAVEVLQFDTEPPAILAPVLTQSNILDTIAALLRNDSLEDATKRIRLYNSTLDVVKKLGSHYATANPTIHYARQVQEGGPDILNISFVSRNNDAKFEESQSLGACLRNFDKQSKNMLATAKAHPQGFTGVDSKQMLSLCQRVSDLADFLLANAAPSHAQKGAAPTNNDWASDLAVVELPDNDILTRHAYANDAAKAQNQALGRMKSLSLQLSTLMTSLPPGVFVRHCTSRLDVMKILIVGPKGTPYENGLFEFDLFCPSNFPNVPPKMLLRTTGGGRVRFNPNLYNCGKGMSADLMRGCIRQLTRLQQYACRFSARGRARLGRPGGLRSCKSSSRSRP